MPIIRQPQRGRGRLDSAATDKGITVIELVKDAIRKGGSIYAAAQALEVTPNTIRYHLTKAGLKVQIRVIVEFVPLEDKGDDK